MIEFIFDIILSFLLHLFTVILLLPVVLIIVTPFILIIALFGRESYRAKMGCYYQNVTSFWLKQVPMLD